MGAPCPHRDPHWIPLFPSDTALDRSNPSRSAPSVLSLTPSSTAEPCCRVSKQVFFPTNQEPVLITGTVLSNCLQDLH
ncbi:Uncharacterized protein DAT39_013662 [Clarias magur]|uniref:Uncharacterized protein n=1 Tax=Clarias magur TaxID=1594786 RepID=A0A8J4X0X3_CLAMG|nr:Uncharacterized protein DAT39_013662 [Clarias magur]